MANENRYRSGPRTLVQVPIESATVVEIGMNICLVSGKAVLPSSLNPEGSRDSEANVTGGVADVFLGIAETASASGETDDLLVDISLEALFECTQGTAAAISFGDRIQVEVTSISAGSFFAQNHAINAGTDGIIAVCIKEHTTAEGAGTRCKLVPQGIVNDVTGQP